MSAHVRTGGQCQTYVLWRGTCKQAKTDTAGKQSTSGQDSDHSKTSPADRRVFRNKLLTQVVSGTVGPQGPLHVSDVLQHT